MKYFKLCIGEWTNESRDKRECSVLRELGAEVSVIAKGPVSGVKDEVDGFPVIRLSSRPLGAKIPNGINRVVSIFTWAKYLRKQSCDVISAHDLIALEIAYLSNIGKRNKAKLVYDSHEFELGRAVDRKGIVTWLICRIERFLMKRCAFSIMVNDSIADEVQRIHQLEKRPVVVRSTPNNWVLDDGKITQTRKEILSALGLPEETFLVMYHGVVAPERGVENMLQAVAKTEKTAAIVLGNGAEGYLSSLRQLCKELNISERTLFHPAVPHEELYRYAAAADVGTALITDVFKSYYLSLPNKFFETIQSLTPLLVSDFPEMGRLVGHYEIGLKVNPANVDEIADGIEKLQCDKHFYAKCKENLKVAKAELCWENEKKVLIEAYREIIK